MTLRIRLLALADRLLAVLLATLLVGATLAFGGGVWWAKPAIALLVGLFVAAWLVRVLLEGTWRILKSPLTFLGLCVLGLGALQLAPVPDAWAAKLSPRSRAVHALGVVPERVSEDDPSAELPAIPEGRRPLTVDRSATLRWLAGATACLALFWGVGQYADRLAHLLLVCGSIVAGFAINTTFAVVQLLGRSRGLYGGIEPGEAGPWGPSLDDLLTTPNATLFRLLGPSAEASSWAVVRPGRPSLFGTMMGGPGAYLALGALALPLALGLALHLLAPRGSRERHWVRLAHSGHGGLVVLLALVILVGGGLVGLMAGPLLAIPFALGLVVVGLPGGWRSGLRWSAVGWTVLALAALGLGVAAGEGWADRSEAAGPWAARSSWGEGLATWAEAARIARDFPVVGSGLGSFAAISPSYKARDLGRTTAQSSLLQWATEAGAAGLAILGLGGLWCLARLPGALKRVGTADRHLAFGLVGTAACFGLFSALHWSIELAAVALAASALGGACNRWLAGGTDLFLERA